MTKRMKKKQRKNRKRKMMKIGVMENKLNPIIILTTRIRIKNNLMKV
jgi:hypothetical protein